MAGYTSRFFLTLTIPSVVALLSALWFLKKRKRFLKTSLNKKDTKLEKITTSNIGAEDYHSSIIITSMKLKQLQLIKGNSIPDDRVLGNSPKMHLKESHDGNSTSYLDAEQQQSSALQSSPRMKGKHKKKSSTYKSKARENGATCVVKAHSRCKKVNDTPSLLANDKEDDSGVELTNGIDSLHLCEESLSTNQDANPEACVFAAGAVLTSAINSSFCSRGEVAPKMDETATIPSVRDADAKFNNQVSAKHTETEIQVNVTSVHLSEKTKDKDITIEAQNALGHQTISVSTPQECVVSETHVHEDKFDSAGDAYKDSVTQSPLTLPVCECMPPIIPGDMLGSPLITYCESEGSNDSGKGGSEFQFGADSAQAAAPEDVILYEFEIPQELCGRLIGRLGRHVNYIKSETNANILIKRHPYHSSLKICAVSGTNAEINNALELIRKRFPQDVFPAITLIQVNVGFPYSYTVPGTLQLHLPEGVTCDVILSSTVTSGHFFLQQPTHPTYPSLSRLDHCMLTLYSQVETPQLHAAEGFICAAPMSGGWYRAQITLVCENMEDCQIKFVDYGGYSILPISSLRQIRSDFMSLPFQATECYLGNVTFLDDEIGWTLDAKSAFEELAQGQILQSYIVGYTENGIPYVHLYRVQGISTVFINRELVNRGFAKWTDHQL